MKKLLLLSIIFVFNLYADEESNSVKYYNGNDFLIQGRALPETERENSFDRLPLSYKEKVRPAVWDLGKNSAGISVDFQTNSREIWVKWQLLNDFHMNHMAGTGIRGIDLYCKIKNEWQYVKTAIPAGKTNEKQLIKNLSGKMENYRLYLPLYDGVENLEIGIDSTAKIKSAKKLRRPLIFYGTSITQGGCASRPGMAYTSIISRKINRECINLGFSGNGRMEPPIAELISRTEAEFIIIDCLPNMKASDVEANTQKLVQILREKKPELPIVLVENVIYETAWFDQEQMKTLRQKNQTLKAEYEKMIQQGVERLFYIEAESLMSDIHEGTVDGVHLTDLGFMRIADKFIESFRRMKLIK